MVMTMKYEYSYDRGSTLVEDNSSGKVPAILSTPKILIYNERFCDFNAYAIRNCLLFWGSNLQQKWTSFQGFKVT